MDRENSALLPIFCLKVAEVSIEEEGRLGDTEREGGSVPLNKASHLPSLLSGVAAPLVQP